MPEKIEEKGARLTRYELDNGWIALAGKSDRDNEILSLKLAHPNDWWFHIRGMPGSHVVLRSSARKGVPDAKLLKKVAAIAAWHSKARNGGQTAVSCTQIKNISKPRGSKHGTVSIRKEKIYKVYPQKPRD